MNATNRGLDGVVVHPREEFIDRGIVLADQSVARVVCGVGIRRIRVFGDPVLRQRAADVTDFDMSLQGLVRDLTDTLTDAGGAGLAAPQIGVSLRVFVFGIVDPTAADVGEIHHIVNPRLVDQSHDQIEDEEGCLSIPGVSYQLPRPARIVASGFDVHGDPVRIAGSERLARCLAHETDHLDGVLFIDRLEPDRRRAALREIREMMLEGDMVQVKRSPHGPLM